MANYSSFIASDTKTTIANDHLSKTSQSTKALEGFIDFDYYHSLLITSPSVRGQDSKLSNTPSPAVTQLMPNNSIQQQEEYSGREKIFRHWTEVAESVCIPEKWGQEPFLKDWMDNSLFDALLAPKGAVSAREALIGERKQEGTRHLTNMERMY